MKVFWSPRAASDLQAAVDYISADNPDAAERVALRIQESVAVLAALPHSGRAGFHPGTREWVFHPWPYIAVYRVTQDAVRIVRVRHAARDWPS
jgi:addiction module RelE/StbE family toxin